MTSLFTVGFQRETWRPLMGQTTTDKGAGDVIAQGFQSGADAFKAYAGEETAKSQAEAAKAQAAAATAQAQAAAIAANANRPSMILGIPSTYFIVGALGVAALAAVVIMKKK